MTPFGPQLIGETEKTLNAILRRLLADADVSEREWVTLRLAGQAEPGADLTAVVADRAHFPDAAALVEALTERGLLSGGTLSAAGRDLMAGLGARLATITAPVWDDLPASDVAAAERVLNAVTARARVVLSAGR